ncbi:unnamed protein product, partial [Discosporangium mesarthrocarpum]
MVAYTCDSGASEHMTFSLKGMFDLDPVSKPMITATGDEYAIEGFGTLSLVFVVDEGVEPLVKLEHVAYAPHLSYNLHSMKVAAERGHSFTTDASAVKHKAFMAMTYRKKPLQSISLGAAVLTPGHSPGTTVDINLFHCAFGHSHGVALWKTATRLKDGKEIPLVGKLETCSGCALGKSICKAVPSFTHNRVVSLFARVFVDLSGRKPTSLGGSYYLMVVCDDFSTYTWVY